VAAGCGGCKSGKSDIRETREEIEKSVENEKMGDLNEGTLTLSCPLNVSGRCEKGGETWNRLLGRAKNKESGIATHPVAIGAVCCRGKARLFVAKMNGNQVTGRFQREHDSYTVSDVADSREMRWNLEPDAQGK
jgi:hypothetical protein